MNVELLSNNYFVYLTICCFILWAKIKFFSTLRCAARYRQKLFKGNMTGQRFAPHLAVKCRDKEKYIFVSYVRSSIHMIAFEAIFDCPEWSNHVQFSAKMTKSKTNYFLFNSCFDWSNGLTTHKNNIFFDPTMCGTP